MEQSRWGLPNKPLTAAWCLPPPTPLLPLPLPALIAAIAYVCAALSLAHLLLEYAVEDEDEHALQGVEDGEEVGHDDGALVDVHQAEGPGQAQQTQ